MSQIPEPISPNEIKDQVKQAANKLHIALLILLTLLIYVGSAWSPSLQDDADAAHAQAAREIVERNDWITLHIDGVRYLEKAPMLYWLVAISYKIFGVNEFATRLPLALSVVLLVVAVYYFGLWMRGARAGLYAGLSVSVGLGVYLFTRIMIPEALLSFFIVVAFYFFLKTYLGELSERWYYVFYVGMAAAVLTKGLIGIVFPCGILFWFVILTGGWRRILQMRIVTGTLLFLAISAPWHILAGLANHNPLTGKGFFWLYFINEHFLRYLGKRYPVDYDTVPLFAFWFLHFVWLFPFSLFLPFALRQAKRLWLPVVRYDQLRMFCWLWVIIVIGFFSFSTRQEYYTFPAFPGVALLASTALVDCEDSQHRFAGYVQSLLALLGLVIAAVLGYLLWLSRDIAPAEDISHFLTSNPENYKLALGHMSDLTASAFAVLRVPAAGAAVALGFGFALAGWLRITRRHLAATLTMTVSVAVFIFFAHMALGVFDPYLSSKTLAMAIRQRLAPGNQVVINGEFQGGSSIGFYMPQQVLLLNGRMTGLEFGSRYPDAPPVFLDNQQFVQLWRGEQRVFIFVYDDKFNDLKQATGVEFFPIASAGEKAVYSNRPDK